MLNTFLVVEFRAFHVRLQQSVATMGHCDEEEEGTSDEEDEVGSGCRRGSGEWVVEDDDEEAG